MCLHTLETGEPSFVQHQLESTGRWLEISVSKMDNEHLITIFTDITPSKKAELHQQRLVDELKRSNAALEEFTRAASHDLKEPVRKVHFFTDKLKHLLQDRLNSEEKGMLQRVETATQRMQLLIDDLLEFSHLSQSSSEKEEIDLNHKVDMILSDLELLVQEKRATIEVAKLPVIRGHRRQIQQLFQNLLTNALKYSKPGVPPHIRLVAKEVTAGTAAMQLPAPSASHIFHCLEISDNGIGFNQEEADRIFNVFTRLHGNKEYPGTGIGLSIVKKVVENHDGFIHARGEEGKGACFTVLLPK
jgi:signal transduction histidine kinase